MLLVVLWHLRYKLSLRDLAELVLARGFVFSHEAVREWETRFAPRITPGCGPSGVARPVPSGTRTRPTCGSAGAGAISNRAIDRDGNRVEALLREKRAMAAAQRFFARALDVARHAPEQVTG